MNKDKTYYRRHLPHYQPEGMPYHIVFRLTGSLPLGTIERLRAEREQAERELAKTGSEDGKKRLLHECRRAYFERFDALLDNDTTGPHWLRQLEIAEIVKESLHARDSKVYDLLAYCIMPNHVHLIFSLLNLGELYVGRLSSRPYDKVARQAEARLTIVTNILRLIKGLTGRECNKLLERSGTFWQHESYDHVIREGGELERTISYVLNNPVKAGLVQSWEEWRWTYLKPGLL